MTKNICFIGGGNMAGSLIGGLVSNGYDAKHITVTDLDKDKLQQLSSDYGVNTETDNNMAVQHSDVVVLATKPQVLADVCKDIGSGAKSVSPLFISIAAGIRSTDIDRWLGGNQAIVRCMPNTPSLIQAGATGLFSNTKTSSEQKDIAESILSSAGITLWVEDEGLLDAVTAVSGSGPAYFFLFMEAMQHAGQKLGLDESTAGLLAKQTALGAARMALESNEEPATLRTNVTSKGGTTAAALASLDSANFTQIIEDALTAARNRAIELADELGKQ